MGAFKRRGPLRVQFKNGDQKPSTIGVVYQRPHLITRFADQNDDDPWRAKISYAALRF